MCRRLVIWSPKRWVACSVRAQCSRSTYDKKSSQYPHFQRWPLGFLFRSKKLPRSKHCETKFGKKSEMTQNDWPFPKKGTISLQGNIIFPTRKTSSIVLYCVRVICRACKARLRVCFTSLTEKWRQSLPLTGVLIAAMVIGSRIENRMDRSAFGLTSSLSFWFSSSLSQSRITSLEFMSCLARPYISSRLIRLSIADCSSVCRSVFDRANRAWGDRYRHRARLNIYISGS
jgi:hypothetical protein